MPSQPPSCPKCDKPHCWCSRDGKVMDVHNPPYPQGKFCHGHAPTCATCGGSGEVCSLSGQRMHQVTDDCKGVGVPCPSCQPSAPAVGATEEAETLIKKIDCKVEHIEMCASNWGKPSEPRSPCNCGADEGNRFILDAVNATLASAKRTAYAEGAAEQRRLDLEAIANIPTLDLASGRPSIVRKKITAALNPPEQK